MSDGCHNCILLIRAAGAASLHIKELHLNFRAPSVQNQPSEPTHLVLERIKQAVEVAGGLRDAPPGDRKPPPEPKNELLREGGPVGPLQAVVYRLAGFLLIGSCLGVLCALIWRATGGP